MQRTAGIGEILAFALVLLAAELLYFSDALRPDHVLSPADLLLVSAAFSGSEDAAFQPANRLLSDVVTQNDPWMRIAAEQWAEGKIPLWNPYAGCGAPLLGNCQSSVFFPLNFIYFCTRSPHAWVVMAIAKLLIAGLGAFLYANELGLSRAGRWFVGLCFPFTGFMTVWLLYALANSAMWLPALLWSSERLTKRPGPGSSSMTALLVALAILGGHPETVAHVLLLTICYVAWRSRRRPLRPVAWLGAGLTCGILLGGVQWIPTAEYLLRSQAWIERSAKVPPPWEFRSPEITAVPTLVLPYVYGSYRRGHPHVEKQLGVDNFNEVCGGYIGWPALMLMVPGILLARPRQDWQSFWLVVCLVALLAVYRMPVVDNLIRCLPILKVAHNQRLLLLFSLGGCLLAGSGLERLGDFLGPRHGTMRWMLVSLLVAAALMLSAAALAVRYYEDHLHQAALAHYRKQAVARNLDPDAFQGRAERMVHQTQVFFPYYYLALAGYACLIAAFLSLGPRLARPKTLGPLSCGLIAVSVLDLFLFGRNYNPAIPAEQYYPPCQIINWLSRQDRPFRVLSLEEEFPPNTLSAYGWADLRNYDAIELHEHLTLLAGLWESPGQRLTSNSHTSWAQVHAQLNTLQRANCRYLISSQPPADPGPLLRTVMELNGVAVFELAGASPFWLRSDTFRQTWTPVHYQNLAYRAGSIRADLQIAQDGMLVVSEMFMPGWIVEVNQKRYTPNKGPFIEVPVSSGPCHLVADYRPPSLRLGILASGLGLTLWLWLLVKLTWSCRSANQPAHTPQTEQGIYVK